MNLIIKKNTTFKIPRTPFLPSSLGGLALWLKADAGVTIATSGPYTYVSQIVITGSNTPNVNGTYTATSVPTFDGSGNPNFYVLDGPPGFVIEWDPYQSHFYFQTGGFHEYWTSSDGVNWAVVESRPDTITISGSTTPDVNGVYTRPSGEDVFYGPTYVIENYGNFQLLDQGTSTIYYTASSATGPWTIVNGSGAITSTTTLVPRGSIIATKVVSSSAVTAWADQSGNGKNMTSLSGNEPTFIASELNGKPVIDFATDKYLTTSFASINFTQQTVFVVFKFVSENLSNYARPFSQSNIDYNDYQTPGNLLPLIRKDGTDDMWCYIPQDDTFLVSLPTSNNTWYISTTKTNGSNGSFLLNGSNEQSFSAEFNADITNMRVGGAIFEDGSFNDPFNSKIAEVIVYNRDLTTPERQQVEAYLNSKYQIY